MFCVNCGKELEDDSKFCEYCGAVVSNNPAPGTAAAAPEATPAAPAVPVSQQAKAFFSNKKNVTAVAVIAAVLVVVLAAVIVINSLPATLTMDDYISVQYEGLSTRGDAELVFNEELFLADLSEKLEIYNEELHVMLYKLYTLGLEPSLDKSWDLTNGDELTILFAPDEEALKELGLRLVLENTVVTVEGLQEPVYLDVFEDLEFTYFDCAPYSWAEVSCASDIPFVRDEVYFYLENAYDLSDGSTFTVHADFYEYDAYEYGYIIEETSKEITVKAEDLPQPVELNPFDYITVTFDGIEGEGEADFEVDYESCNFLYNLDFDFNKDYELTEGEVITLSFTNPYNVDPLRYGYTLTSTTAQQHTVPKLDSYITSFSQLSADVQKKLMDRADYLAHYYLTKEKSPNGTLEAKLTGTEYSRGNELSHAASTGNVLLHSIVCGTDTGWWSTDYYMIFIYTFDITGHPNVKDNDGNVAGACAYVFLEDPIINGDGTLDNVLEEEMKFNYTCYLDYDTFVEDYLDNIENQDVYTAG